MTRRAKINGWMALPLVLLAAGGLLWHVLACVESPMSFAPGGDLAFTTMQPYDSDDLAVRGRHVYRLMVLPAGASAPKVLEESVDWIISAPGFSGDGKRIAYFRIPLLTAEDQARIDPQLKSKQESLDATTQPALVTWPPVSGPAAPPSTEAAGAEPSYEDMTMPAASMVASFVMGAGVSVPAQLVERRAADGEVISVTPVDLPVPLGQDTEATSNVLYAAYILGRPQYSRDGQWILFCPGGPNLGGAAIAVCPSTKKTRLLGAAAAAACLSPDGKTLAMLQQGCLGFVRIDGSLSSYVRWQGNVSLGAMVWTGNDTLAVLSSEKIDDETVHRLSFVKMDGTVPKTVALAEIDGDKDDDTGQLALSPDGKSVVVSFDEATYFLNGSGKCLSTYEGDDEKGQLAQPTFSPNGKQVAFKVMKPGEGETHRTVEIAFFSPAGKEQRRVAIPPPTMAASRPATPPPATSPSGAQGDDF